MYSVQLRSDVVICFLSSPHPGTTDPQYPNYRPLVSLYPRSRPTGSVPPPPPPSFACRGSYCRAMEHDSGGGGVDSRCGGPLSVPTAAVGVPPHQLGLARLTDLNMSLQDRDLRGAGLQSAAVGTGSASRQSAVIGNVNCQMPTRAHIPAHFTYPAFSHFLFHLSVLLTSPHLSRLVHMIFSLLSSVLSPPFCDPSVQPTCPLRYLIHTSPAPSLPLLLTSSNSPHPGPSEFSRHT